ncbi:tyrosine-type recombinase/integrase [Nocardia sp. NPDC049707]|uniref:tyrosine-type recombinase/integrase n=1 Tax=Nocardia sp. NPDC049707 TaxID=3154735 RepID=UPI00341D9E17
MRYGQDKGFTWHDGRHFFVSLLLATGVDPEKIRKLVGHSSGAVTLRVYTLCGRGVTARCGPRSVRPCGA